VWTTQVTCIITFCLSTFRQCCSCSSSSSK
jgi:hypothetical protein